MTGTRLGISESDYGNYYDTLLLSSYHDASGGNENAIIFAKSGTTVWHTTFGVKSTNSWGTPHKFMDDLNCYISSGKGYINNSEITYVNSAGNADTVDNLHASAFSLDGHTHSYASAPSAGGPANNLRCWDIRDQSNPSPNNWGNQYQITGFFHNSGTPDGGWWSGITTRGWHEGYASWQLCGRSDSTSDTLYFRSGVNSSWNSWYGFLHTGNYTSYCAKSSHTHGIADLTDKSAYMTRWPSWSEVTSKPTTFTPSSHSHWLLYNKGDDRNWNPTPQEAVAQMSNNTGFYMDFANAGGPSGQGTYSCRFFANTWGDWSGGPCHEIRLNQNGSIYHRCGSSTSWGSWETLLTSSNYDSYLSLGNIKTVLDKINGTSV